MMRDKDQADWDLERCFDLFDEALTSKDERVINALRNLLMIVALTAPEVGSTEQALEGRTGPLRRLMDDYNHLSRRMSHMEEELRTIRHQLMPSQSYSRTNWPYYGGGGGGEYSPDITTKLVQTKTALMAGLKPGLKDDEC